MYYETSFGYLRSKRKEVKGRVSMTSHTTESVAERLAEADSAPDEIETLQLDL